MRVARPKSLRGASGTRSPTTSCRPTACSEVTVSPPHRSREAAANAPPQLPDEVAAYIIQMLVRPASRLGLEFTCVSRIPMPIARSELQNFTASQDDGDGLLECGTFNPIGKCSRRYAHS